MAVESLKTAFILFAPARFEGIGRSTAETNVMLTFSFLFSTPEK